MNEMIILCRKICEINEFIEDVENFKGKHLHIVVPTNYSSNGATLEMDRDDGLRMAKKKRDILIGKLYEVLKGVA